MEFAVDIVAQRRYLEEDEKFKKLILEEVSGDVDLPKGFNHFVASIVAPGVSGWSSSPGGAFTHWKTPPLHGARQKRSLTQISQSRHFT